MSRTRGYLIGLAVLGLLLISGCAGLGTSGGSSQVLPSSIGIDTSLSKIRNTINDYHVYYDGFYGNPDGILFVPRDSEYTLRLDGPWRAMSYQGDLRSLILYIEYDDITEPVRLRALVTPEKELLGFIYSKGSVSVRQDETPNQFYVSSVSVPNRRPSHEKGLFPGFNRRN